jgi:antitoxin (DNA-binding transcriptional repressor) of toxin-antitoxin stability system
MVQAALVGPAFQAAAGLRLGVDADGKVGGRLKARPHFVPAVCRAPGPLRQWRCDATIYHMETVSIRDLRYRFPKVQRLLERGEAVQITKRKRVIGTLTPAKPSPPPNLPDFLARAKKIWKKPLPITTAEIVAEGRKRDWDAD